MAILKTPLLSFGATGTVGQALTVSRWKGLSIAKKVPTHPDARTAAQLAHRELYSHARDYWHTLTLGERASLLSQGRPYHITGYNLLLRRYLTDLLHLEAWWPLNDGGPPSAHDYSLHNTHGTVFGCIAADDFCGQHDNAFYFDGINDRVVAPAPQLNFTSADFSLTARIYRTDVTIESVILARGAWFADGYEWVALATDDISVRTYQAGAWQHSESDPGILLLNTWHTVGLTRQGNTIWTYLDGTDVTLVHGTHTDPDSSVRSVTLGQPVDLGASRLKGRVCDVKAFSSALTPAQHLAIHQRYCVHPPR